MNILKNVAIILAASAAVCRDAPGAAQAEDEGGGWRLSARQNRIPVDYGWQKHGRRTESQRLYGRLVITRTTTCQPR